MYQAVQSFRRRHTLVEVYQDKVMMGQAAAEVASGVLRNSIRERGSARIVVGTGPSQQELIANLVAAPDLDWSSIEVFHMDEYVGISADHPASFRRWLRDHVVDRVPVKAAWYMDGDALDTEGECRRYAGLLQSAPIDITFIGFGENGHIAFNDPHVADFQDPLTVKRVRLDDRCRMQQVGEGHFATMDAVPPEAITITCPGLMRCRTLFAFVPDRRKAEAARCALEGPLTEKCPASLTLTHSDARVFLDVESASLLTLPHGRGSDRLLA
jgi:glucosamine-6-phosphate deaminase